MRQHTRYIIPIMRTFFIASIYAHAQEIFIPKSALNELVKKDLQMMGTPYSEKDEAESSKYLAPRLLDSHLMRQYLLDNKLMKEADEKQKCEQSTLEIVNSSKKRDIAQERARTRLLRVSEKELEDYYKHYYEKIRDRYNHGAMRSYPRPPFLPDSAPPINDHLRELTRQELYEQWLSEEISKQVVQKSDNTPHDSLKRNPSYGEMMNKCFREAWHVQKLFQQPFEERAAQEFDKMSPQARTEAYKKYEEKLNYLYKIDNFGAESDVIRNSFIEVRGNELAAEKIEALKKVYTIKSDSPYILDAAHS